MNTEDNDNTQRASKAPLSEARLTGSVGQGFGDTCIVVTGAAGFIGSCMVSHLNSQGYENLILVDEFNEEEKELNLLHKKYTVRVERENFFDWVQKEKPRVAFVLLTATPLAPLLCLLLLLLSSFRELVIFLMDDFKQN